MQTTLDDTLIIRQMQATDIEPIAHVFASMNKTRAQYERYWRENVENTRVTLVAWIDAAVVGYTNIIWSSAYAPFRQADIPEINDMNVVAPWRGRGIGRRLIFAAEEIACAHGKSQMGIGVGLTPDYAIAQHLYPRLGYVYDGRGVEMDPWGGAMYLTKPLTDPPSARSLSRLGPPAHCVPNINKTPSD